MPWLNRLKILLIDDEQYGRTILKQLLEEHGAEVAAVGNAADALYQFKFNPPALIISDISMPDINGYELLWRLRTLEAARGGFTPAIAVTGFAGEKNRIQTLRAGFSEHVGKPYDPAELIAIVAAVANGTQQHAS
jgi:CheY-like chemotaxis protein